MTILSTAKKLTKHTSPTDRPHLVEQISQSIIDTRFSEPGQFRSRKVVTRSQARGTGRPIDRRVPIQEIGGSDGAVLATISAIQSIELPEPGQLRARKVVTRSQSRSTGKYPSWKMGRMLQWESLNELNAFRLLDCDPNITRFTEQPCEIVYVQDGAVKNHFPDILIETNGRKELWEVKPETRAVRPEIVTRTALLTEHLPTWGYSYRVVLDRELARQPRLRNADRLLSFGRDTVTECEQEFIRLALKRCGALVWSDACAGAYGSRGREILCHLALNGTLSLDMNATWSADTRFTTGKAGI